MSRKLRHKRALSAKAMRAFARISCPRLVIFSQNFVHAAPLIRKTASRRSLRNPVRCNQAGQPGHSDRPVQAPRVKFAFSFAVPAAISSGVIGDLEGKYISFSLLKSHRDVRHGIDPFVYGWFCNGPYSGSMMLPKHSAWLEKGPEERFPKSSIAYRPGLMQRTSDIISLMYWGVSIMAPVRSFQKTIERMSVQN